MKSRNYWDILALASLPVCLALSLCLVCLGCNSLPTRKQVEAAIWSVNTPLPADACGVKPATCTSASTSLWCRGFYRFLNDGKLEFISFCAPESRDMKGVWGPQLKEMLDKYLPDEPRKGD